MIDPMSRYPGYLLRRASAMSMARLAKRLRTLHLNPTDATILIVIDSNPNAKQSEIGRLLDIARANMAPLISRLATRKLIERQPVDGRSHGLTLTRSGQTLIPKIKNVIAEHEAEVMGRVPVSQRDALIASLQAVMEQL